MGGFWVEGHLGTGRVWGVCWRLDRGFQGFGHGADLEFRIQCRRPSAELVDI